MDTTAPKTDEIVDNSTYLIDEGSLLTPAQKRYFASSEYVAARQELQTLAINRKYTATATRATESADEFVNRHLLYLSRHPLVKHEGYLANLKLMTSTKRA